MPPSSIGRSAQPWLQPPADRAASSAAPAQQADPRRRPHLHRLLAQAGRLGRVGHRQLLRPLLLHHLHLLLARRPRRRARRRLGLHWPRLAVRCAARRRRRHARLAGRAVGRRLARGARLRMRVAHVLVRPGIRCGRLRHLHGQPRVVSGAPCEPATKSHMRSLAVSGGHQPCGGAGQAPRFTGQHSRRCVPADEPCACTSSSLSQSARTPRARLGGGGGDRRLLHSLLVLLLLDLLRVLHADDAVQIEPHLPHSAAQLSARWAAGQRRTPTCSPTASHAPPGCSCLDAKQHWSSAGASWCQTGLADW